MGLLCMGPSMGLAWLGVSWRRMVGRSRWQQSHGCISLCGGGAVPQMGGPGAAGFACARDPPGWYRPYCPTWHGLLAPGPSLGKRGLGRHDFPFRAAQGQGRLQSSWRPG